MPVPLPIQAVIRQRLEEHFAGVLSLSFQPVGGGSINQTYRLQVHSQSIFCKINSAASFPHLLEKERIGLQLLQKQARIKTPEVMDCFETGGFQVLLLEWIDPGERTETFWKTFGEQLASIHQVSNDYFGLFEDNYMGSVPQRNQPATDWVRFFIDQRLEPMVKRCADKKLLPSTHHQKFETLYGLLPRIFDVAQKPALVHGDLWSGNFMCNRSAEPVLIDPAVYYGHPAVDLGMSTLFGGFRPAFYEAYHYHSPFSNKYEEQWQVCNLYPLLIHLDLFGSSYLAQIEQILDRF